MRNSKIRALRCARSRSGHGNGKLERGELLRQIDIMRDMGFGGFFMHSRTGT